MTRESSHVLKESYRFSIAPMMDCTDRHFRVVMRQITRRSLLYTEMIVANALHHNKRPIDLLSFNKIEHPISLQLGGDNPKLLADATKLGKDCGYDEINLNVGCPSPKVKSGNFGACLMADPDQVARCIEAMANASELPVTVKHRIGIDNFDSQAHLTTFVDKLAAAGAKRFAVHARKAWLEGLNPKENRTIPPLEYEKVIRLKKERPQLIIEINGGLNTPNDCINALKTCDGAMVGRAAYSHPMRWTKIDQIIFGENQCSIKASSVIHGILPYVDDHLIKGGRLWDICRHLLQLVEEVPGAKSWRRELGQKAQPKKAEISVLENAAQQLLEAGL